jgi:hypothetical protein
MSERTWRWVTQQESYRCSLPGCGSEETVYIHQDEERPHVGTNGWRSPGLVGFIDHKTFTATTGIVVPNTHPIKVEFGGVKVFDE